MLHSLEAGKIGVGSSIVDIRSFGPLRGRSPVMGLHETGQILQQKLFHLSEVFFWLHPRPLLVLLLAAVLYYGLPVRRVQNAILFALGAIFAIALSKLFFVQLFGLAAVESFLAIAIHQASGRRARIGLFAASVALNVGVLVFLLSIDLQLWVQAALSGLGIPGWPTVPRADFFIGSISAFSMFTLQSDAFSRRFKERPGFWSSMVFSTIFYRFVGLPVQRARDVLANLAVERRFDRRVVEVGIWLVFQGCVKQFLANRLGERIEAVESGALSGPTQFAVYWLFAVQSWTAISSIIDIASGLSHTFGLPIAANFDAPFLATNIADFWRRWHTGFTNWLGEEIFSKVSFALRRWGSLGLGAACFATFAGSALGHSINSNALLWGASWGFLFWAYFENRNRIAKFSRKRGHPAWFKFAGWFFTAQFIVVSWGVLRCGNISESMVHLRNLFRPGGCAARIGDILGPAEMVAVAGAVFLHTAPHFLGGDRWLAIRDARWKFVAFAVGIAALCVYA